MIKKRKCTVLLSKRNHRTRVLQPQRDIDREKGREKEGQTERETDNGLFL